MDAFIIIIFQRRAFKKICLINIIIIDIYFTLLCE
jgi:hypothetical protein